MKTLKFLLKLFSFLFGGIYLILVIYTYFNQINMMFHASKLDKNYTFNFENKFEELTITSFDKVNLHGLLFKAEKSKGLIFYLHGNQGGVDSWGNISKIYTNLGYDIFILDYRGFGKSEGTIESEVQFNTDVTFAYKKLISRYQENKTIIIGYSIGTGPATILASKNNPKALVLQAPYFSFTDLAAIKVPYMPRFLHKFKFETNRYITKIKSPVYLFHGNNDQLISYSNSLRLEKLLKPSDQLFTLQNQGHVGINENEDFQKQLKLILE